MDIKNNSLVIRVANNFADNSDLSEWRFGALFCQERIWVVSKYKQSDLVQHLKKYGGFSEHTLILYCKKRFGEAVQIVF